MQNTLSMLIVNTVLFFCIKQSKLVMNNEKCRISWGSSSDKGEKLNKNSSTVDGKR